MVHKESPLDNPVWSSLETVHAELAIGNQHIKRYRGNVLRMFGCEDPHAADLNVIEPWLEPNEQIFMVGQLAALPPGWKIELKLDCTQMICNKLIQPAATIPISRLTKEDAMEMLALVNLVQPGYYYKDTPVLGDYVGIRIDGQLVAMAGERLRMNGFAEISAVVTNPLYAGRGFAQQLVAWLAMKNIEQNIVPFLQFVTTNSRARKVYQLLGFEERREITFWKLSSRQGEK